MKEQEIKKLELALGFKREIVGIKFIFKEISKLGGDGLILTTFKG